MPNKALHPTPLRGAGELWRWEWAHGGYHEIHGNRRRNTIIDLKALAEVLEIGSLEALRSAYQEWVAEALSDEAPRREDFWSQSLAVGSAEFVRQTQIALGHQGRYRRRLEGEGMGVLREGEEYYGAVFGGENEPIGAENALFLDVSF